MGGISVIVRSDLLLYCLILDCTILITIKINSSKDNFSLKLYSYTVFAIALVTLTEAISWLSGEVGNSAQIPLHYWSNAVFLALTSLPAALGIGYLDYKIFKDEEKVKKRILIYLIPTYTSIAFAIYNIFDDGFLFTVNEMNQYSRGIGVLISIIFLYAFFICTVIFFCRKKKIIPGRLVHTIVIFFFTPILGSILQTMAYGTTFGMPSYTLAAFIIFLILEKDEMGRDELTHLYTRSKIIARLRNKLKSNEPFSLIMMDLDGFKSINDTYGHAEGDRVLIKVAEVLKQITTAEDVVCRYGGDEFLILIEYNEDIADKIMIRINNILSHYNQKSEYKISLSSGYEFVKNPLGMDVDELIHNVDKKMYDNKQKRRQLNTNNSTASE